jgi:hypothetical protein
VRCLVAARDQYTKMPSLTQKNHYNPCFWTAHWNPVYFASVRQNRPIPSARDQRVAVLSVKADKVYHNAVKNVHFEPNLGIAEVTMESADDFCRRNRPEIYESFKQTLKPEDYPVIIDFESLFGGLEGLRPYQALLEVIKKNCITSAEEKIQIAHFILYQRSRCHAVMNAILEQSGKMGRDKFEPLIFLKWALSETRFLHPQIERMTLSRWMLYRLDHDTFPLSDSAVLLKPGSIMATLSPRLLLEINLGVQELGQFHQNWIEPEKLAEFRRRTIGNTFREIIFGDQKVLEEWQRDPCFRQRVETIRNLKDYDALVQADRDRGSIIRETVTPA